MFSWYYRFIRSVRIESEFGGRTESCEAFQGVSFHLLLVSLRQKIAISFGISPPLLIVFSEFADYI
jgi:hypothetical protein